MTARSQVQCPNCYNTTSLNIEVNTAKLLIKFYKVVQLHKLHKVSYKSLAAHFLLCAKL